MGEFLKSEGCEALDSINPDRDNFCSITTEANSGRGLKDKIVRSFSFYDAKTGKYGYCHYSPFSHKIVGQYVEKEEYKKVVSDFYLGINKYTAEYLYKVPQDLFDKIIDILLPFYFNRYMKTLRQFIKESLEEKEIQDLEVVYIVNNEEPVSIQAPSNYSEDDLTIYLQDKTFEELPGSKKLAGKFFNANASKLIDVHYEYNSFKREDDYNEDVNIEWDNEYDTGNSEKNELSTFILDNLKYILTFESFGIKVENDLDVDNILHKIFDITESNTSNKYPLEIKIKEFKYKASL